MVRRQIDVVGQTVNDDGAGRRDLPLPFAPSLSLCAHAIVGEPSIRGEDVLGKNLAYNLQSSGMVLIPCRAIDANFAAKRSFALNYTEGR